MRAHVSYNQSIYIHGECIVLRLRETNTTFTASRTRHRPWMLSLNRPVSVLPSQFSTIHDDMNQLVRKTSIFEKFANIFYQPRRVNMFVWGSNIYIYIREFLINNNEFQLMIEMSREIDIIIIIIFFWRTKNNCRYKKKFISIFLFKRLFSLLHSFYSFDSIYYEIFLFLFLKNVKKRKMS